MAQVIRPSWLVAFWVLAYMTVFHNFEYQPVERILDIPTSGLIALLLVGLALIIRLVEGSADVSKDAGTTGESGGPWQAPGWLRALGCISIAVSTALLLLVCIIVITSEARTILGWQSAVDDRFPTFGRIFLHLKQIAIPYLVLTAKRRNWKLALLCGFYVVASLIYSFALGERVFFLETALLLLLSAMMRGWLRLSVTRMAQVGALLACVFMIVENAKKFIFSDTQVGNLAENFSLVNAALTERLLAYYADPAAKLQFAVSQPLFFVDARWFKDSIGIYLSRSGLGIDNVSEVNAAYWGGGYGGDVLTNPGGFTTFIADFGPFFWLPTLLFLIVLVFSYRRARSGSLAAACVYLIFAIAAIEMPRVAYVYWGRFWMPLGFMVIACVLFKLAESSIRGINVLGRISPAGRFK